MTSNGAAVVQFHNQNGGMSRYRKFRHFQQHFLNKPPLTEIEEKQLDIRFSELVVEAVIAAEAVPGAVELIRQQVGRIPLFVASGTPETELKVNVEASFCILSDALRLVSSKAKYLAWKSVMLATG